MRILKFGASWCQPCKAFKPALEKFAEANALEVEEVDIETETGGKLSEKYDVQAVPTTLFVNNKGEELAALTGAGNAKDLEETFAKAKKAYAEQLFESGKSLEKAAKKHNSDAQNRKKSKKSKKAVRS